MALGVSLKAGAQGHLVFQEQNGWPRIFFVDRETRCDWGVITSSDSGLCVCEKERQPASQPDPVT